MMFDYHDVSTGIERSVRRNITFNRTSQIELLEDLLSMLNSGVKLYDAFTFFVRAFEGGQKDVSNLAIKALSSGKSFTTYWDGWFSPEVISVIRIGEERSILINTLPRVIEFLKSGSSGLGLFLKKLAYPGLILMISFFMADQMSSTAYPILFDLKPDINEWPTLPASIYLYWEFILKHIVSILSVFIGIILFIRYVLMNYIGEYRSDLDGLPIFRQYRLINASIFMQMFGLLLRDVAPMSAIEMMERHSSVYMKSHYRKMLAQLSKGATQGSRYLKSGLLDATQFSRLSVLSDANDFEDAISLMGEQTLTKTTKKLEQASTVVGAIGLLVSGVHLVTVLLGVMLTAQTI